MGRRALAAIAAAAVIAGSLAAGLATQPSQVDTYLDTYLDSMEPGGTTPLGSTIGPITIIATCNDHPTIVDRLHGELSCDDLDNLTLNLQAHR